MIQYPHTLKNNIYISNNRGPPTFFHSYTNTVLDTWSILLTKPVLVVTVELIWLLFLNIISFNYVPTSNKFLRFTRFIKSYAYCPAIVLIKSTLLFCLMCVVQSRNFCFFEAVCSQWLCVCVTPVARVLLTPRWTSKWKDVK